MENHDVMSAHARNTFYRLCRYDSSSHVLCAYYRFCFMTIIRRFSWSILQSTIQERAIQAHALYGCSHSRPYIRPAHISAKSIVWISKLHHHISRTDRSALILPTPVKYGSQNPSKDYRPN